MPTSTLFLPPTSESPQKPPPPPTVKQPLSDPPPAEQTEEEEEVIEVREPVEELEERDEEEVFEELGGDFSEVGDDGTPARSGSVAEETPGKVDGDEEMSQYLNLDNDIDGDFPEDKEVLGESSTAGGHNQAGG
ncbi:hypothetical protein P7C73_g5184, partial [Tremellales sp. Uapishka_1]